MDSKKKSLSKTISWRVIAILNSYAVLPGEFKENWDKENK